MGFDEDKFAKLVAACVGVDRKFVDSRLKHAFLAFVVAYSSDDAFFRTLEQADWEYALNEATATMGSICPLPGCKPTVTIGNGEATIQQAVYPGGTREARAMSLDVTKVASQLCKLTGAGVSVASVAECMQAKSPASICARIVMQIETNKTLEKPESWLLKAAAIGAGAKGASISGDVASASTAGRFECDCLGSRRVGCVLCDTGPMLRWCWHGHALSQQHVSKMQEISAR